MQEENQPSEEEEPTTPIVPLNPEKESAEDMLARLKRKRPSLSSPIQDDDPVTMKHLKEWTAHLLDEMFSDHPGAQAHRPGNLASSSVQPPVSPVHQGHTHTEIALDTFEKFFYEATAQENRFPTDRVVPLDPLSKPLTDKPEAAVGLLLAVVNITGGVDLWQVVNYCPDTKKYQIAEVVDTDGSYLFMGLPQLKNCSAFSSEYSEKLLTRPNGNTRRCPLSDLVLLVRVRFHVATQKHSYRFVTPQGVVVTEFEVTHPGHETTTRGRDSSSTTHNKTSQLSSATIAYMNKSNAELSDMTGTSILHAMHYMLSLAEKEEGTDAILCARYSAACLDTAQALLDFRPTCLSHWRLVPREEAEANLTTKKSPATSLIKDSVTAMGAWYNYETALQRTFEFSGELYEAIHKLGPAMELFLRSRASTYPELTTNGFCMIYLNHVIVRLCQVLGNPHTTSAQVDSLLRDLRVDIDTGFYTLALNQVTREKQASIDSQLLALTRGGMKPRGQSTGRSTTAGRERDTADGTKKKVPCYRSFTTRGCTFKDKCTFDHTVTKLTPEQKVEAREAIVQWNKRSPDKTPYAADESKF